MFKKSVDAAVKTDGWLYVGTSRGVRLYRRPLSVNGVFDELTLCSTKESDGVYYYFVHSVSVVSPDAQFLGEDGKTIVLSGLDFLTVDGVLSINGPGYPYDRKLFGEHDADAAIGLIKAFMSNAKSVKDIVNETLFLDPDLIPVGYKYGGSEFDHGKTDAALNKKKVYNKVPLLMFFYLSGDYALANYWLEKERAGTNPKDKKYLAWLDSWSRNIVLKLNE